MEKERLAAFSDGVIAIIITIMVLELKPPHEPTFLALGQLWPIFFSYVLSFVYIAIYWNNHHHLLHAVHHITGRVLWANFHLLFWLSLIPFTTAWMSETDFAQATVAVYGASLLMPAIAYFILTATLLTEHQPESMLARAIGKETKEKFSLFIYTAAVAATWVDPRIALAAYVIAALIWIIPDQRIERAVIREQKEEERKEEALKQAELEEAELKKRLATNSTRQP